MQSHSEVLGVEASTRDFDGHPGHINKSRESSNFLIQVWRRVCCVVSIPYLLASCLHTAPESWSNRGTSMNFNRVSTLEDLYRKWGRQGRAEFMEDFQQELHHPHSWTSFEPFAQQPLLEKSWLCWLKHPQSAWGRVIIHRHAWELYLWGTPVRF